MDGRNLCKTGDGKQENRKKNNPQGRRTIATCQMQTHQRMSVQGNLKGGRKTKNKPGKSCGLSAGQGLSGIASSLGGHAEENGSKQRRKEGKQEN